MKQYKTCNNCRALVKMPGSQTGMMECTLGYSCVHAKSLFGITVEMKPTEPCPKPKTYAAYIENYNKSNKRIENQ